MQEQFFSFVIYQTLKYISVMKALEIMKKQSSVEERASQYFASVRRDIMRSVIDPVMTKIDRLKDDIIELKNFSLDTDINKGINAISKDEVTRRFALIVEKEYLLELAKKELEIKMKSFGIYFGEEKSSVKDETIEL
jgi:hypothetical protein